MTTERNDAWISIDVANGAGISKISPKSRSAFYEKFEVTINRQSGRWL